MQLRGRLFVSFIFIVLVCLITVLFALAFFLRNSPILPRLAYTRLSEAAAAAPQAPALDADESEWRAYVRGAAAGSNLRVLLLGGDGTALADSDAALLQRFPAGTFSTEALARRTVRDVRGRVWLFAAIPAGRGGRQVLFMEIQPRLPAVSFLAEGLFFPLAQAGLTALCLSLILAVLIARSVAEPLRRTALAAQNVAQGRYDQRVPLSGPPEVQAVAAAFNEMSRQVQASQQAQRDFLANVSHELKTPLTSIQGFAQAILDGAAAGPEAQQRSARVIYAEADRMRRLVEGLLDLARLDAGQAALAREPVDLGALLGSVAERLGLRAAEKQISLRQEIARLPGMVGDGDRLAQVFTNLLDNALKHTPPQGIVTLAAAPAPGDGMVEVTVTDTGPGIPAEDLARIFERFYQVDKSRKGGAGRGAGLGLAISREIVAAHGGTLRAESVVGLGSKFVVRLPLAEGKGKTQIRNS
jgi:signal transduction histidine kinase